MFHDSMKDSSQVNRHNNSNSIESRAACVSYVQDYVQDERYIASEHMDVRRDCVSFAQLISICMGAKVVQCLVS